MMKDTTFGLNEVPNNHAIIFLQSMYNYQRTGILKIQFRFSFTARKMSHELLLILIKSTPAFTNYLSLYNYNNVFNLRARKTIKA